MTDKERLEFAAKAAGIKPAYWCSINNAYWCGEWWNPLTDDGDALRLAIKLRIDLEFGKQSLVASAWSDDSFVGSTFADYGDDPYAATRRAIVSAAAEIGKDMK